ISQRYPVTEPMSTPGTFSPGADSVPPTQTVYDVLDRPLLVTLPDGTRTTNTYGFEATRSGETEFVTTTTDPRRIQSKAFRDVRGNAIATEEFNNGGTQAIWTTYAFDALGELSNVTDHVGNHTTYAYDKLGRMIDSTTPDQGRTTIAFDPASNVTS